MGDVIHGFFTEEEQDLVGMLTALSEAADSRDMVALAFVCQADDGSYEMSWCGDIEFPSAIEHLKILIRQMRKAYAAQIKKAASV